jgi:S1-C subfamily serine protease
MYRIRCALGLAVLLGVLAASARGGDTPRLAEVLAVEEVMQEAIKKAEPSIACILVARADDLRNQDLENPRQVPEGYGSGVVVDDKGLILTNYHVVRDAVRIFVRLPGDKACYADIHAADPRSDLAVLKVRDAKLLPLKALKIGDGGNVRKGQWVLSLANPWAAGFKDGSPSASWGILSNVRRRMPGVFEEETLRNRTLHHFGTLLQTDARINLGCSGGALIDLKGELIGLTTALAAVTGGEVPGGFAVPMDAGMRRIIDVLKRGEEVEYGFLGVSFPAPEVTRKAVQSGWGIPVGQVVAGSPASSSKVNLRGEQSGGRHGDFILSVNGMPVRDPDDLFLFLGTQLAGSTVKLEVAHGPGDKPEIIAVTLAKFWVPGKIIATNKPEALGGLRVDYTSVLYLRLGERARGGIHRGVVIREVVSGSAADTARLQEDKTITRVNGREVNTPEEFYKEMQAATGQVELTLMRSDGSEDRVKIDLK